jgi:glycosyltransferase involved in cell wall biosynthesis
MKIALVAQHATPTTCDSATQDGDTRLIELSRSLAGKGHQVTVYAGRHGSSLPERAKLEAGVEVEYIGPAGWAGRADSHDDSELLAQVPAFSQPLHDLWRRERPDVVHALRWTSGLASLAAARDLGVPVVQTFDSLGVAERRHHRATPLDAGTERMRLEPAIGRSVSAVMAGSSDEESDLTRLGVPRRSIKVVPCGVDTDEFTPEGPAYERNDRDRLVTVADLGEVDALGTLLRAVSRVPSAELVIAGGPPRDALSDDLAYRRLAKLADSLDLSGRVFFAGQVGRADLPPLLRSASLLVNVSEYEPSAMTSIQAMACGTPVIAAAVGGQIDAVVDGTTGILVPPGRPALLAQRIRQLLSHPILLEAFSVAATDRARSRYSLDRIAHETIAVYDKALDSTSMSSMAA